MPTTISGTDGVSQLLDNSVTANKIVSIPNNIVTTASIAASAVTADKINLTTSLSSNGYQIMPAGLIIQWGEIKPSSYLTDIVLPIPFPNICLNVQTSIGEEFVDSPYTDNSLIWGGFPKTGDLTRITIMSNLRVSDSIVTYRKIFWLAIGY